MHIVLTNHTGLEQLDISYPKLAILCKNNYPRSDYLLE